ncbi:MAG: fatty acyl-AMP ligase [Chloroflexi bacterium]|nr:fatty acyl-AMP ligase [Chloroflexota bacterium]
MPPSDSKTLIELLAYRAEQTAVSTAYTYLQKSCTYQELWQRINRFAAFLQTLDVQRGERVVIALPNGHDFFDAFYGAQRVGGTAVPIYPGFSPERILTMVKLSEARIVILPSGTPPVQLNQFKAQAEQHGLILITVADAASFSPEGNFPEVEPDDVAFIQYTSGSTGNPKGVQLSHRNLLDNVRQMIVGMEITADEIFVSWLPVYHDMGLILKTMVPFYLAATVYLLPSSLRDIDLWLDTIQIHCATFTAAPDFAYRLALRRIADPSAYDLSSLRVALNAAEPVRASTIEAFEAAFDLQNVMVAGYGLAEATVGVSMWKPSTPARVNERGQVSIGRPFPHITLTILQEDQPVDTGEIGEIAIQSIANTRGYLNNPAATAQLFWQQSVRSGDLGYLDEDGYLYIVGRKKNIIIHAGQSVYPQEVEEVVNGVKKVRYSAAVGIDRGRIEGEQVVIFAEVRGDEATPTADFENVVIEIVQAFNGRFGFRPARVYLVKPKTIPMTYNGKLQHQRLKAQFLDGRLADNGRILFS